MDWSKVENLPKYNPYTFTLVRHLEGLAKWELAKISGLSTKRISDIEDGNVSPTDEEVSAILKSQSHVIEGFFEQWTFETDLDISHGCIAIQKPINYYKYKIFRDLNPPPLTII